MISANVGIGDGGFVATLSDGRILKAADLQALADTLSGAGVPAHGIRFEWRAGHRMPTAGQQVALRAHLRGREGDCGHLAICA